MMVDKVREAVAARRDDDFIIIARTGAVRNESFERALERCAAYREAGADVLMLFSGDPDQIAAAGRVLGGPLSMMAPADRLDRAALAEHGFNVFDRPVHRPGRRLRRDARRLPEHRRQWLIGPRGR